MLEWTGERFIPGAGGLRIQYEHLHRYEFAADHVQAKRVLDFGFGEGYGARLLAKSAEYVVGIDVDPVVVDHARQVHGDVKNLRFDHIDDLTTDEKFDLVTCFEVIEHVADPNAILDQLVNLVSPDGCLLISTPNKAEYSDRTGYRNEFHLREFYVEEFRSELLRRFAYVQIYGQRILATSMMWDLESGDSEEALRFKRSQVDVDGAMQEQNYLEPMYVVAICSPKERERTTGSIFLTRGDRMSNELLESLSRNEVERLLAEFGEERRIAQSQLDEWWNELNLRAEALSRADELNRELTAQIAELRAKLA